VRHAARIYQLIIIGQQRSKCKRFKHSKCYDAAPDTDNYIHVMYWLVTGQVYKFKR